MLSLSQACTAKGIARYENGGTITYGYQRTFFRKFGIQPSRVTPGAVAVGATSVMVFCFVLGLFLHGAASFLLFGVAATLAIYLVLIGGAFVVDGARRCQPPHSGL
jgi:acyl-coenzyme A thioesterase PaaI-like protein